MGPRGKGRRLAKAELRGIENREPEAIDSFKQMIAENPKAALAFLVSADLAISRGKTIEWCKPDRPALVIYRKATRS